MPKRFFRTTLYSLSVLCLLLVIGCQKNTPISQLDLNTITITPVTTPTVYRYGPCTGQLKHSTVSKYKEKTKSSEMLAKYSAIQAHQQLIWHIFVPEIAVSGKRCSPHVPIVDITMDTDLRGQLGEIDVTFPVFESMGSALDPKIKKQMKTFQNQMENSFFILPEKGIISGETLLRFSRVIPLEKFTADFSKCTLILDGEFTRSGTTYVVARQDDEVKMTEIKTGIQLFLKITGYCIFQKKNMEEIFSTQQLEILDGTGATHANISTINERLDAK